MAKTIDELENLPDINLLEDDGITLEGIMEQMITDYQEDYKKNTGGEITLYPANPDRMKLNVMAGQIYQIYEFIEHKFKQNFIRYMTESSLKNWGATLGFSESNEKMAKVMLEFGVYDALDFDVVIPEGTRATAGDDVYFATDVDVILSAGECSVPVNATCTVPGTVGNDYVPEQISTIVDSIPYISYVTNISTSSMGEDEYDLESLREQIYLYPATYSVAGPEDAYISWVKKYDPDIIDVKVVTDENSCVNIYIMLKDGVLPIQAYCDGVEKYLKELRKFPDTDKLSVLPPDVIEYAVYGTYYISSGNKSNEDIIKVSVQEAGDAFVKIQYESLGKDINTDILVEYVRVAGAKRIEISSPGFMRLEKSQIAICTSCELRYGGLEDD